MDAGWEHKIWGRVKHVFDQKVSVSLLQVEAQSRCSIHYHRQRHNEFRVIVGVIDVVCYRQMPDATLVISSRRRLGPGMSYLVQAGTIHCFEVVQSGSVVEIYYADRNQDISIDDIVRLEPGSKIQCTT